MTTRAEKIEIACSHALAIASDDSHGYSNVVGDNFGQNGDYDCGGFVYSAYKAAGVLDKVFEPNERYGNPWSYGTVLEAAGFERLPFVYSEVQRGDILIKDGQHTELALGNGRQVGAHWNYDGARGDYGHSGEISEVALSTYWDCVYRLKDDGSTPAPAPTPAVKGKSVTYRSYDKNIGRWLPEVTSGTEPSDTAGIPGHAMGGLAIKTSKGTVKYAVHDCGGKWLKFVKRYDINDENRGMAGDYKSIDAIAIKSGSVKLAYRVKLRASQLWLPWVYSKDCSIKDPINGFAGVLEREIDEIEIKVV